MLKTVLIFVGSFLLGLTIKGAIMNCLVPNETKECLSIFKGETDAACCLSDISSMHVFEDDSKRHSVVIIHPGGWFNLYFRTKASAEFMLSEIARARSLGDRRQNTFVDDFRRDAQVKLYSD